MIHIDEKILELYLLGAAQTKEQWAEIEVHLKECSGCAALYQEMKGYYDEVEGLQAERAEANKEALTLRSMIVRVPPYHAHMPREYVPATIPARVVLFVVRHYLISSASLFALVIAALLFLSPGTNVKDLNPSYARAKEEFLVAYNKEGAEVWREHIGPGYDEKSGIYFNPEHPEQVAAVVDIDGDGKNEVISIFGWIGNRLPLSSAIICYGSDRSERWKYVFHGPIKFGNTEYSDDYKFHLMTVGDYARDGNLEVIAVAGHESWLPTAVVRLDARDGSLLSTYWHPGVLERFAHKDIDGDGFEELFFACKNGSYGKASLIVFDPRKMEGYAPLLKNDIPQGIGIGTEKYYVLFPASDIEKLWAEPSQAVDVRISNEGITEVSVHEQAQGTGAGELHYFFDSSMKCIKVLGSNGFIGMHSKLELEGRLTRKIDDKYYEELRKGVQYWDGKQFVHEVTMNKHYVDWLKSKQLP